MKKIFVVVNFFCFLISFAFAETYYVSNTGSDSNTGLIGYPWQTLQYAVNRLKAGDVLIVEDGTYTGFYMDRIKGTASQRITIKARNRLGAVINQPPPGRMRNVEFLSCSYVTFDGFEVTGAPGAGIAVRTVEYEYTGINCRDNIIQYCHSHHNSVGNPAGSHDGIFTGFALNVTIQYNICNNNGEHGIYVSNSADNPIVRGNIVYGNFNNGIHINSDMHSGGDGIINNWLVEDNIIYDNGRTGINLDGASTGVCRNNLLYNNRGGIALYQIDGAQGANNNLVVNNTIYTFLAPTTPNTGSLRAALQVADNCNNNTIFNNIIYAIGPGYTAAFQVGSVTGLQHNYNIVGRFGGSAPHYSGITASSYDLTVQPSTIFNDVANNIFTLIPGCVAIDSGINVFNSFSAPTRDILGVLRPQAAGFDRGCYEMEQSNLTNTPTRTATIIATPTRTFTNTQTRTNTAVATNTNTAGPTQTRTNTTVATNTNTVSPTQTRTDTITPTYSISPTTTQTPTGIPPTLTNTPTSTLSSTYTYTPTAINTNTAVNTATFTATLIQTIFITNTNTPIYSPTENINKSDNLVFYENILLPNPVPGDIEVKIRFTTSIPVKKITVEIYTIALRKIYELTEDNLAGEIIISKEKIKSFANGIYLYRLKAKKDDKTAAYAAVKPFIIIKDKK